MVTVRPAIPEDNQAVSEVCALGTATLRETYRPKLGAFIGESTPRQLTPLVAEFDGRVVGTVQYYIEGDRVHIVGLMVRPDFRRQGVARRIVEFLEDTARGTGLRCLSLNTVKQTGNVAIFRRLGFETISEGEDEWAESDKYERLTDVYMEKVVIR